MPSGIYIRTNYHKKRIKESTKGWTFVNKNKKIIPLENRYCKKCNKLFETKVNSLRTFCCVSCAQKSQKPTKERKLKISNSLKGHKYPKERNEKISKTMSGIKKSIETKLKMRQSTLKRISDNYGKVQPNYNKKACEIFKQFDELNKTSGRYAVYGNGEYLVKKLHYYLDYINFEKKLIIEVDDNGHFKNEYRILKDKQRQQEIQKRYPDFRFLRFKNNEMNKILEITL